MERERRHRDRVSKGRVFLAGDAAHIMPPRRTAATPASPTLTISRGNSQWSSTSRAPRLLDSYESERKPQCDLVVEQATRYVKRVDPSLPASNLAPLLDDAAISSGPFIL